MTARAGRRPPMVSVLLPYRQAEETVAAALTSVLTQRDVALEVVAIDDGSTDRGAAHVAHIAARDPRVRMVAAGGAGLVRALRCGLTVARGALIARMDADDECLPHRFARQVALLRDLPRVGACGTQVEAFAATGATAVGAGMSRYVAWQNTLTSPADHARELFIESPLCHPSVMLRREALEQVGPWRDIDGPEDYDLWLRLASAGWQLAKVPQVLLRWRQGNDHATWTDTRYARARFTEVKAPHLARRLRALGRPIAVWGAGRTGKRLARALESSGVHPERFVDIDRNKIGREARGRPIVAPFALERDAYTVVVAVGAIGARDEIRAHLRAAGHAEGRDFLCAA